MLLYLLGDDLARWHPATGLAPAGRRGEQREASGRAPLLCRELRPPGITSPRTDPQLLPRAHRARGWRWRGKRWECHVCNAFPRASSQRGCPLELACPMARAGMSPHSPPAPHASPKGTWIQEPQLMGLGGPKAEEAPPCPAGCGEGAPRARVSCSSLPAPDCQGMINGQRHRAAWAAKCCIVRADTERARTDSNTILPRNRQPTFDGRNSGSVPPPHSPSPTPFPSLPQPEQSRKGPSQAPGSLPAPSRDFPSWAWDGNRNGVEMEAEFEMGPGTGYEQRRRLEWGWGKAGQQSFPPHLTSCTGNLKRQSRSAGTEFFQPYSQLSGSD